MMYTVGTFIKYGHGFIGKVHKSSYARYCKRRLKINKDFQYVKVKSDGFRVFVLRVRVRSITYIISSISVLYCCCKVATSH